MLSEIKYVSFVFNSIEWEEVCRAKIYQLVWRIMVYTNTVVRKNPMLYVWKFYQTWTDEPDVEIFLYNSMYDVMA